MKPFYLIPVVHSYVLIAMAVLFTFSCIQISCRCEQITTTEGPFELILVWHTSDGRWVDLEASWQTCVPVSTWLCQCTAVGAEQLAVFDQSHTHTPICRSLWMLRPGCRFHAETTVNISLSPALKRKSAKAPAVWQNVGIWKTSQNKLMREGKGRHANRLSGLLSGCVLN